jgi:hypothetical protein
MRRRIECAIAAPILAVLALAAAASPGARAEIFDLQGRRVADAPLTKLAAGRWAGHWNLRDRGGVRQPAGVYIVRSTIDPSPSRKLIRLPRR